MPTAEPTVLSPWRLLVVWLAMAVAMSVNGIVRELALKRVLPATLADVASALLGIVIIVSITRAGFQDLRGSAVGALTAVSGGLVGLTVAFELVMGRYVDHKSWSDVVANYAVWRGRLWPIVLLTLALTPFMWGRWWPVRRS